MVFSSVFFIFVFLPILLVVYYLQKLLLGNRLRNIVLLLFSVFFYIYGAGDFVIVLFLSIAADYLISHGIIRKQALRKPLISLSLAMNLALLAYFKYANFFVEEFNALVSSYGGQPLNFAKVLLPIGISFFTFQKISYIVDVYKGKRAPLNSFSDYALYVIMFSQLIAGPILRFNEVSSQLTSRKESLDSFYSGTLRFCWGLIKKVIFANSCGEMADTIFALKGAALGTKLAWLGSISYTLQIYYDFSGYSDMAIGLGLMFGFRFPENFSRPYSSQSITEFWQRWHMTLSRWMKDYLYIPLGGNRLGDLRTYMNLVVVFLLCGLWHGANWTFIAWGAYHGIFLIIERALGIKKGRFSIPSFIKRAVTLLIIIIGWVIFRAESMGHAMGFLSSMFTFKSVYIPNTVADVLNTRNIFFLSVSSIAFFLPAKHHAREFLLFEHPAHIQWLKHVTVFSLFLYSCSLIFSGSYNPFIYFQF